jgi:hypothetical protein
MKRSITLLAAIIIFSSCSKKAEDFKAIAEEYKTVLCTALDTTSNLSDKTRAVARQNELNQELQKALGELEMEESSKLSMMMATALADASQGKCN